ncbi:MAG: ACP S-malonyltransferase [Kistimonas sp.]|nr:ACP S-malonyltransferase [Kistimonas sp.]
MDTGSAFLFPGQGSQQVGMLGALIQKESIVSRTLSEASYLVDVDLLKLIQEGPAADLDATCNTQPALLACSVALWRLWEHFRGGGGLPAFVAGHSLGEYSALVAARVLDFGDALRLVRQRGLYMQEAVPVGQGGMLAVVGLDDAKVSAICVETVQDGEVLSAANYNAPGQVVVAGSNTAIERARPAFLNAGARMAKPLAVSVPSHCRLMDPVCQQLEADFASVGFAKPVIPVVQNVSASLTTDAEEIRSNLIRQVSQPVLWAASVKCIADQGVTRFFECGPGRVLAGLGKRMQPAVQVVGLEDRKAYLC